VQVDSVAKSNLQNSDEAYAAIKKRESFAFTFFASTTEIPQSYGFYVAELSILLLVALSKPNAPPSKTFCS
jgi:hypothetical protein